MQLQAPLACRAVGHSRTSKALQSFTCYLAACSYTAIYPKGPSWGYAHAKAREQQKREHLTIQASRFLCLASSDQGRRAQTGPLLLILKGVLLRRRRQCGALHGLQSFKVCPLKSSSIKPSRVRKIACLSPVTTVTTDQLCVLCSRGTEARKRHRGQQQQTTNQKSDLGRRAMQRRTTVQSKTMRPDLVDQGVHMHKDADSRPSCPDVEAPTTPCATCAAVS